MALSYVIKVVYFSFLDISEGEGFSSETKQINVTKDTTLVYFKRGEQTMFFIRKGTS